MKRIFKNKRLLIKNTLIIIMCSIVVRGLSLFNRILLTRLLGNEGISLYIISLPTIMLVMTIGGMSLSQAVTTLVSENLITNKYNNKVILKKSALLGLLSSIGAIIILFIFIKPLTNSWLDQKDTYYPILMIVFFLPIVVFNNIIRGYLSGIGKVTLSSYLNTIEQISRIIASVALLLTFKDKGIVFSVSLAIISMGIGELISLIFAFILLKKNFTPTIGTSNPIKEISGFAIPLTLSRLVTNFSLFLEPIIYTQALKMNNFPQEEIMYKYSMVNAYTIPLITMFAFFSTSIATSIYPSITKSYTLKDSKALHKLIEKALIYSLIPGILICLILFNYSSEFMNLIYATTIGADYVKMFGLIFILFYVSTPINSILQAVGSAKYLFKLSIITNAIKIFLIFALTFIPEFSFNSLIISVVFNLILVTMVTFFKMKNVTKYKITRHNLINLIILFFLTFCTILILKASINNFILASIITILLYLVYIKLLGLINI